MKSLGGRGAGEVFTGTTHSSKYDTHKAILFCLVIIIRITISVYINS